MHTAVTMVTERKDPHLKSYPSRLRYASPPGLVFACTGCTSTTSLSKGFSTMTCLNSTPLRFGTPFCVIFEPMAPDPNLPLTEPFESVRQLRGNLDQDRDDHDAHLGCMAPITSVRMGPETISAGHIMVTWISIILQREAGTIS